MEPGLENLNEHPLYGIQVAIDKTILKWAAPLIRDLTVTLNNDPL